MTKEQLIAKFEEYVTQLLSKQSAGSSGKAGGEGLMGMLGSIGDELGVPSGNGSADLMSKMKNKAEELIGQSGLKKDDVWDDLINVAKSALSKFL